MVSNTIYKNHYEFPVKDAMSISMYRPRKYVLEALDIFLHVLSFTCNNLLLLMKCEVNSQNIINY